jgi:sialate O-acetylesterase
MIKGGAVLQRRQITSVWGTSTDKTITLTLAASDSGDVTSAVSVTGAVNSTGDWLVYLPPQTATWNRTMAVTDSTRQFYGFRHEAILCAGQSNMGMQVRPIEHGFGADNATAESAATIRYTGKIQLHSRSSRYEPAQGVDFDSSIWFPVTPTTIQNFSSVCWLTGRDLFDAMGGTVPVGIAMNAVGAHPIEAWMGPNELKACGITSDCGSSPNSKIWGSTIVPMHPYSFGACGRPPSPALARAGALYGGTNNLPLPVFYVATLQGRCSGTRVKLTLAVAVMRSTRA